MEGFAEATLYYSKKQVILSDCCEVDGYTSQNIIGQSNEILQYALALYEVMRKYVKYVTTFEYFSIQLYLEIFLLYCFNNKLSTFSKVALYAIISVTNHFFHEELDIEV